jgi:hypothetical protein
MRWQYCLYFFSSKTGQKCILLNIFEKHDFWKSILKNSVDLLQENKNDFWQLENYINKPTNNHVDSLENVLRAYHKRKHIYKKKTQKILVKNSEILQHLSYEPFPSAQHEEKYILDGWPRKRFSLSPQIPVKHSSNLSAETGIRHFPLSSSLLKGLNYKPEHLWVEELSSSSIHLQDRSSAQAQ